MGLLSVLAKNAFGLAIDDLLDEIQPTNLTHLIISARPTLVVWID